MFLIVANSFTGGSDKYHVKSSVYKMADNKFYLYQRLPTTGAQDIRAFMHDGTQYLVVVNLEEGTSHNIASIGDGRGGAGGRLPLPPLFCRWYLFLHANARHSKPKVASRCRHAANMAFDLFNMFVSPKMPIVAFRDK